MSIGARRFFKRFFRFLLFIYIIASLAFIGYYVYQNYILKEDTKEEKKETVEKEEVKDLAEGKIYLNNTLIDELYAYLPKSSSMYNTKEVLYKDFDQNALKARAFELIEKADYTENDQYILSETTLNAKVEKLYGSINIKKESFSYYVDKPLIKNMSSVSCTYKKNKYYCSQTKETYPSVDELKYIEYATKDEEGSIHIYEKYLYFEKNGDNYDVYKDYLKQEKITTINQNVKSNYKMQDYIDEYKTVPTYEHIFKKKGNNYYLYETKLS